MKTPEQLKGTIRSRAKKMNIKPQELLQIYMFERLVERIAVSQYKDNFVLKGGLLIASLIGVGERTTMDMDATLKGMQVTEEEMKHIMQEIFAIDVHDGILFEYKDIRPIRADDLNNNFCVLFRALYGKMKVDMKIDITTGDTITPREIDYRYTFMLEDRSVLVKAYTLETILAEKYQTVIGRNIGNTRARDFYDLYNLLRVNGNEIRWDVLRKAVLATAEERDSLDEINNYSDLISDMRESEFLQRIWKTYQEENTYSADIAFEDTLDEVLEMGRRLEK